MGTRRDCRRRVRPPRWGLSITMARGFMSLESVGHSHFPKPPLPVRYRRPPPQKGFRSSIRSTPADARRALRANDGGPAAHRIHRPGLATKVVTAIFGGRRSSGPTQESNSNIVDMDLLPRGTRTNFQTSPEVHSWASSIRPGRDGMWLGMSKKGSCSRRRISHASRLSGLKTFRELTRSGPIHIGASVAAAVLLATSRSRDTTTTSGSQNVVGGDCPASRSLARVQ